jgi:hypothetical protein
VHAIAGVVGLNLLLLVAGSGALWGVRGWKAWSELARLAGLAYLLGVASVGVLLVNELVLGIPFAFATVVLTALFVFLAGVALGRALGRTLPPLRNPAHERVRGPMLISAVGAALATVYLEALFRAGRLADLYEWDAMAFWVPKAKAIYYFGGLDEQFFRTLAGPSYPPLVPALEASAFEFMGATDEVTLHLMFWFLFAGFLAAVAGLLAPHVHAMILWPALLLVALTSELVDNATLVLADKPLDYFIGLAVLLLALWLLERSPWQLALAGVFLAATMLTKREGYLFVACAVAAAIAASWRTRRTAWPALVLVAGLAFAISRPWHHWFASRGIARGASQEGPALGYLGFVHALGRVWPSLRLTLSTLFVDGSWLLVAPLCAIAITAALVAGSPRVLPVFAGSFLVLGILGCSWVTATTETGTMRPIVRFTGGLALPIAGLLPLLLDAAWRGRTKESVP